MSILGRCCRCNCDKINFKVFDFSNGTLLWEKLLWLPVAATNGDVYALDAYEAGTMWGGTIGFLLSSTTLTLPTRAETPVFEQGFEYHYSRYDGSDGSLLGSSPAYGAGTTEPNYNNSTQSDYALRSTAYQVNDDGDIAINHTAVSLNMWFSDWSDSETSMTYWINVLVVDDDTDVTIKNDDDDAATFKASDDAATIESAITAAFGATVSSVTVSGETINTSMIKIEIEWSSGASYLKSFGVQYPAVFPFNGRLGNTYLRNLRTGIRGSYLFSGGYGDAYMGHYCWQDTGELFRIGARPTDATVLRVESWDMSTTPGTLTYYDEPFASKHPSEQAGLSILSMASYGGYSAITFRDTASISGGGLTRMTVITYADTSGTRIDYHNGGNHFTGDYPEGVCFDTNGTDIAVIAPTWRDTIASGSHTVDSTRTYLSLTGDSFRRWSPGSATAAVDGAITRGDFNNDRSAGFRGDMVALWDLDNRRLTADDSTSGVSTSSNDNVRFEGIARICHRSGSNILHSVTTTEIDQWELNYLLFSWPNSLADSDTEWRLRWWIDNDGTAGTSVDTKWFTSSATLSDLNSELLTVFGENNHAPPKQNVVASSGSVASPVTVPLYQQALSIDCFGALNEDGQTEMGTPEVFTIEEVLDDNARSRMGLCLLEVRNYSPDLQHTLGARSFDDGEIAWSRNFNATGSPKNVTDAMLHENRLLALSKPQCAEGTYGDYGS